ncbi:MAG TPA: glycoside hydrolase family 3 N-terminal domain-containing protein [Spirochaetales bacterium]|nr:glycoside hydrolase family 3 N-terminal domain-containing protein [Spirochaetales bacterium]HPM72252.1 glycoside hydrolase family 3 N-terminal domain-containing protein [Spirochaetales bacterium]
MPRFVSSSRYPIARSISLAAFVAAAFVSSTAATPVEVVGLLSRAETIADSLDDEGLVGQLMMIGVEGVGRPSNASRLILERIRPGAVILFGFNVDDDPRSVASLAGAVRDACSVDTARIRSLPPFVAIDHEGGGVYRFKGGLTRLPAAATMGLAGAAAASAAGSAAGTELRALGVTMNAAPVVEALNEANRGFLAGRAWSDDPAEAAKLSASFIVSCQRGGAAAVAKHFPGNAEVDPHRGLPVLTASRAVVEGAYLAPFRAAVNAGVAAIMLSHAIVPAIDPDRPVSVSPKAVAILKGELGFSGIVLTDDLQMAALDGYGDPGLSAVAALAAGADMVMLTGGRTALGARDAILAALADGRLTRARLRDAAVRVIAQKLRFGLDAETDGERDARLRSLERTVQANTAALKAAMRESAR